MEVIKKTLYLVLLALFLPTFLHSSSLEDEIKTRFTRIRRRFNLNRAIGVMVQNVDGQILYAHNANKQFIPASGMKLVTMAAALHYLDSKPASLLTDLSSRMC